MSEYLLAALVLYGSPVLCVALVLAAVGLPLPASLLLVAAGSFIEQGQLELEWVLGLATVAAVTGDQIGYILGRWGGRRVIIRLSTWAGGEARLAQAEAAARRWGGLGVFLTRWLFSPLGPALNLASGITGYPWPAFLVFDVVGEALWVLIYVLAGRYFSDRVQVLSDVLGNLSWVVVALALALVLGWKLLRSRPVPKNDLPQAA